MPLFPGAFFYMLMQSISPMQGHFNHRESENMKKLNELGLRQQLNELTSEVDSLCVIIRHTEEEIRDKYKNRIPTSRHRIRTFIEKRISQLRTRDQLFQEYYNLHSRLNIAMDEAFKISWSLP